MEVCQILDDINKYRGRVALLWHSPGIPVFRKVAQEDSKFKTSLDLMVRSGKYKMGEKVERNSEGIKPPYKQTEKLGASGRTGILNYNEK